MQKRFSLNKGVGCEEMSIVRAYPYSHLAGSGSENLLFQIDSSSLPWVVEEKSQSHSTQWHIILFCSYHG